MFYFLDMSTQVSVEKNSERIELFSATFEIINFSQLESIQA